MKRQRIKPKFNVGDRVEVFGWSKSFGIGTVESIEFQDGIPVFTITGCLLAPLTAQNGNLFPPKETQ